jgi:hypothetical protein
MICSRCIHKKSEWYNTGDWFEDSVYKWFCIFKKTPGRFIGYDEPFSSVKTPIWCPIKKRKKSTSKNSKKLK